LFNYEEDGISEKMTNEIKCSDKKKLIIILDIKKEFKFRERNGC